MATPTYELIETTTLASSASSVTFSSITQDYRDLVLVAAGRLATGEGALTMRINGSSSSIYSLVRMSGDGSSATSNFGTFSEFYPSDRATWSASYQSHLIIQFFDFATTDKHKTILSRSNAANSTGTSAVEALALRWGSTSAITSFNIAPENPAEPFASGSTFALYGIAA